MNTSRLMLEAGVPYPSMSQVHGVQWLLYYTHCACNQPCYHRGSLLSAKQPVSMILHVLCLTLALDNYLSTTLWHLPLWSPLIDLPSLFFVKTTLTRVGELAINIGSINWSFI